jgi:hypothetical protein
MLCYAALHALLHTIRHIFSSNPLDYMWRISTRFAVYAFIIYYSKRVLTIISLSRYYTMPQLSDEPVHPPPGPGRVPYGQRDPGPRQPRRHEQPTQAADVSGPADDPHHPQPTDRGDLRGQTV